MTPGREPHKADKLTVVIIPAHGGSMLQWRMSPWGLGLVLVLAAGLLGAAALVLGTDLKQRADLAKAQELKQANLRIAADLVHGRDALIRVAQLEDQLRRMLKFKTEKALIRGQAIGGPTDQDVKELAQLLDESPEEAVQKNQDNMAVLIQSAEAREKNFDEIRSYVLRRSTLMAARPEGWPVHGWISSGFGPRVDPVSDKPGFHTGVDIANDTGTPIHVTADGVVAFAGWEGGYGKLVVVNHGNGYSTYYGHMSEIKVPVGKPLHRGDVVGLMGATGNTTGPHVHYEVRLYGAPIDPIKYMRE